ncbi:hypothetical protein ES677_09725 [Bizionia gelidisalsuginis]|uniref:Uncharacterized protein n=1 Tax=Bizionia gelidisalsuginis TaxID=291188 RepID=A0ABY3M9V8_9FLAO|nr:hypothetical protein [Bizionia gelidisalsuginis]TYC12035.1 hypothetical protein ES677_09725 [Bizionia gelidisalsuginis]
MNTLTTLKENLSKDFVIYVPEAAFTILKGSIYEGVIPVNTVNKLYYLETKEQHFDDLNDFSMLKLINKNEHLENNLFLLFEAKKEIDIAPFQILLNKYKTYLEGYMFITNWMYHNIDSVFKNLDLKIVNLFKLQLDYFERHTKEFDSYFDTSPNDDLKFLDQFKTITPTVEENVKPSLLAPIETPIATESNSVVESTPPKKQKLVIDDEEVDRLLLTSVFNVTLD